MKQHPHPRLEVLEAREVPAQIGALDPSFAVTGKVRTTFGGVDAAVAVAVQADGKIVVVGNTSIGNDFAVARYNPDGSFDTTFDGDGQATINFGFAANDEQATCVAVQDDGKIVIGGFATVGGDQDFVAARLKTDGTLDTDFSGDGKASFNFAGGGTFNDQAFGVAIQGTGAGRKIVLVGSTDQGGIPGINFGVLRLNDNGTTDVSFNRTLGGTDIARAVAIDASNRIVVTGFTSAFGTNDFAVMRFTAAGADDAAFAGNTGAGTARIVDFGGDDQAVAVALQGDGKIVAAGSTTSNNDFAVLRLNTDGTLDPSFDTDGKLTPTFGGVDKGTGVVVQPDGKIVVAGFTDQGGGTANNFAVARLNPDGTFDPSFDADGKQTVEIGGDDRANGVALDNNGRILLAGSTTVNNDFATARLPGLVERPVGVAVGGSTDGRATTLTPDAAAQYGTPVVTPAGVFPGFTGNVRAAVGDVDGDGFRDTILVTGPGTAIRFAVISGADNTTVLVPPTAPFAGSETFTGGGFVTAADFDNDGRAEFVFSPDQGGGPRVTVFSLVGATPTVRANFFGINNPDFRGGARVGAGDMNNDGVADLAVAAGFQGGPVVELVNGRALFTNQARLINPFFVFPDVLRNGVFVAIGDVNGDGFGDLLVGAGPGGGPVLKVYDGQKLLASGATDANRLAEFFVGGSDSDRSGVRVATVDADGDNRADVVVGTGGGVPARLKVYLGKNFAGLGEPAVAQTLPVFGGAVLTDGVFVG